MSWSDNKPGANASRRAEADGYALVALLALMAIIALLVTAAAPSIRHQNRRALEREAIARGEEVAEAIRVYVRARNALPTSMDELVEGVPVGTKKVQVLRPSAARDPLSSSGEWRLIKATDPALTEFQQAVILYAGGVPVPTRDQHPLFKSFDTRITGLVDRGEKEPAPNDEDTSTNTSGPFIGVASRSRRASILTYYDIERHDKWIFTPLFR